jgi:hypothetical protein
VYETTPSLDPARDSLVYHEAKTLREYGLAEEEAEHEATQRLIHSHHLTLSPQLVHHICRRYARQHPREGY